VVAVVAVVATIERMQSAYGPMDISCPM
jgi:hypothetical protein